MLVDLPVLVRLAGQWGLLAAQSVWLSFGTAKDLGRHKRSVWTFPSSCAIPFSPLSHRTNPLSAVFLWWSQIPRSPPPTKLPHSPPAPSKTTNTALCSADYSDILIQSYLKGRSHCKCANPHWSFTLFKQIHQGLYLFGPAKSNSFSTMGGL